MGILDVFRTRDVLYFPGCVCFHRYKERFELYQEIFSKLGVKFRVFDEYTCCGLEALEAGYESHARRLARKNLQLFQDGGVSEIITTSPNCLKMFLYEYPEFLPDWDIEVVNVWKLLIDRLESKHRLIKNKAMETVTFHDSCYLGRGCGIYDEPRKILELIGYEVKEMDNFREDSFCCGSCGGLVVVNPKLAGKVARERVLQAKRIGVKKMIVCGFENYDLMKRNCSGTGVEVLELSEVLGLALGIEVEESVKEEYIDGEDEVLDGEDRIVSEAKANVRLQEELKEGDRYSEVDDDRL